FISRPEGAWPRQRFCSPARRLVCSLSGRCTDRRPASSNSFLIAICNCNFFLGATLLRSLRFRLSCCSRWRWRLFLPGGGRDISATGRRCWLLGFCCCCARRRETALFGRCRLFLYSSEACLPICW